MSRYDVTVLGESTVFCDNNSKKLDDGTGQICTTQTEWRASYYFFEYPRKNLIGFYLLFIKQSSKIPKVECAGQIKSIRRPHLARGPYVVHAWVRGSNCVTSERICFTLLFWPIAITFFLQNKFVHQFFPFCKNLYGRHV